jgi:putative oxidoreductase
MQSGGLPAFFIWPVIAAEIGGGLALAAGFLTRLSAFGLAVFTVVAGVLFHAKFGDMGQTVHFAKNMAITGGLLSLVMSGAGPLSLDALLWRRDARE